MTFKPYCEHCASWHTEQEEHVLVNRDTLIAELKKLRDAIEPASDVVFYSRRLRDVQNLGGYLLRKGRLDKIISELEKEP